MRKSPVLAANTVDWTGMESAPCGRIQHKLGQETFARRIAGSNLFELDSVSRPRVGVFVDAVEVRIVPEAGMHQIDRPPRVLQIFKISMKPFQSSPARLGS
jgi:hypothetical protein